jgi:hypothetical protein
MKAVIAALGMLALAGTAQAGETMQGVSEQLQAVSSGGKVVVTMTVHNGTAAPVYVPKALYQDQELFGRLFEVREQGGAEIDYTGPMVKRGPYGKADYLKLMPGATRSNRIDITRSYAFKPGAHTYQIGYSGHVLTSLAKLDAPLVHATAPVTFTHTGQ